MNRETIIFNVVLVIVILAVIFIVVISGYANESQYCKYDRCKLNISGDHGSAICNAVKCEALVSGRDGYTRANGFHSLAHCVGMRCVTDCIGNTCVARCLGNRCYSICGHRRCKTSWYKNLTGQYCQRCRASCIGPECVATALGKYSRAFCRGKGCRARCLGYKCRTGCRGWDCRIENNFQYAKRTSLYGRMKKYKGPVIHNASELLKAYIRQKEKEAQELAEAEEEERRNRTTTTAKKKKK